MRRHPLLRRVLALHLLVAFAACYSYVPVEDGTLRTGDEVRISTREGGTATESREVSGGADLQGVVISSDRDSLTVWHRPFLRGSSLIEEVRRDTVSVARAEIRGIQRSELDAVKTAGLVVGSLGVIAGFALLVSNAEGGGGGFGGDDGGRLQIRLPLP